MAKGYANRALSSARMGNHRDLIEQKLSLLSMGRWAPTEVSQYAHIELQLTDACNLECAHCHFRSCGSASLPLQSLDVLVNRIKPRAISLVGGGEPTCYPDLDKAVGILGNGLPGTRFGIITNGVTIPPGHWTRNMSWLRVSLYELEEGRYCGRPEQLRERVVSNFFRYLAETSIPDVGISLLLHGRSVGSVPETLFELMRKTSRFGGDPDRVNVQLKLAFSAVRPGERNIVTHRQNQEFLCSQQQLSDLERQVERLAVSCPDFGEFLAQRTNWKGFCSTCKSQLDKLSRASDPNMAPTVDSVPCYYCLAFALVTPQGGIYPCPSIAEFRDPSFALDHLADYPAGLSSLQRFHHRTTEICGREFCRYVGHNEGYHMTRKAAEWQPYCADTVDPFF